MSNLLYRNVLHQFFATRLPIVLILSLLVFGCNQSVTQPPLAKNGTLLLRNWDFKKDGVVRLNGEWHFYWQEFIDPRASSADDSISNSVVVPGFWTDYNCNNEKCPADGYASYRLLVELGPDVPALAIKLPEIGTAFQLIVNGQELAHAGQIGKLKSAAQPGIKQSVVRMPEASNGSLDILINVSNFDHARGGLWYPIQLGDEKQIENIRNTDFYYALFLFGSLFIMGLYHLGLYSLRPAEKSPLAFGALCLVFAFRLLHVGDQFLLEIYPDWDFHSYFRLGYAITYILPVLLIFFLRSIFPAEIHWAALRIFAVSGLCLTLAVYATPGYIYTGILLQVFLVMAALNGIYCLYAIVLAVIRKRDGARVFIGGLLILILSMVNDGLNAFAIIATGYFAELGFFTFIFSQAYLLSRRFSSAFHKNEELTRELIKADQIKDEFLANTSHELRTPLNGIIGIADSIIDGVAGPINSKLESNLQLIVQSGRRLNSLVNDILDFSKLKDREIALNQQPAHLQNIIDMVVATSNPLIGTKKLEIVTELEEDLPPVLVDYNRIQQVFYNLLGNAIKFTENGTIIIKATSQNKHLPLPLEHPALEPDKIVNISITDTGIGIPAEKQEHIFQEFQQADASTERSYGGTGLGLSISRKLIEMHGGTIQVISEPGKGSEFSFCIPVANLPVDDQQKEQSKLAGLDLEQTPAEIKDPALMNQTLLPQVSDTKEDFSILVVDDDPINRQVLSNILQIRHINVILAEDGHRALEILEEFRPHLVLLDVMMPRLSGYEVCQKIREKYSISELPVIMLTAKSQLNDMLKAMQNGANDYLTKPFSKDELMARMNTHLHLWKINDAISRFVPHNFLYRLGKEDITQINLGDQIESPLTVFFSDIRNFTTLSESMTPRESFNFLNAYLRRMGPVIRDQEGFVDKYIGDSIMALFPQNPDHAMTAAVQLHKKLIAYNLHRSKSNHQPIQMGIGIHTGPLILGIIGEDQRLEGTVIGDAVNLASRLESLTKVYRVSTIISEGVLFSLKDPTAYQYRMLDRVKVKGKQRSVAIYDYYECDIPETIDFKNQTREIFETGITLYMKKEFQPAIEAFEEVQSIFNDQTSDLYIKRCAYLLEHGTPPEWVAVSIMD